MRSFRQLVLVAALLLQSLAAFADDVITNVMSPVVSFQYPDNFSSQALTNGGVLSPIVSYQYFEWPGDNVLGLWASPRVSYFYSGNDGTQVILQGRVTGAGGVPLSGAAVSVAFGNLPLTGTTSDVNGNYALPLGAGVYALSASASGYAKSSRVLTFYAGTAPQNFQLAALPATPDQTPVDRQPAAFSFPPIGSLGEHLKVFNGTAFVDIVPANTPSPAKMTIVLTHGWIPQALGYEVPNAGVEGWPTTSATAMVAQGVTPDVANIVAWDWRYASQGTLPPEENIPGESVLLGQSLRTVLGSGYLQPVHFVGHSLGALVNAGAANYLNGHKTAQQAVSPTPWVSAPMHFTLFDHGEVSRIASLQVLFDGLTLDLGSPTEVLKYASKTLQGWKPSLPVQYEWADNYISQVGFYLPNTMNVALQKAPGYAGIRFWEAHSYPMSWYNLSIASPTYPANPLGFKRSYEYSQLPGVSLPFPPSIAELSPGDAYHQTPGDADQLALEPLPPQNLFQLIVPLFGNGADVVVQGVTGTIQIVGDVAAEVRDAAAQAGEWVTQGFNYVGNTALQGGQSLVNLFNSGVLRLRLRTTSPGSQNLMALRGGPVAAQGEGDFGSPPMAWLPIQFPANATAMAFDFIVEGEPVEDVLVCGIGTNNLFSLEAKYIPTNAMSASRLIDVSAWAGTTNELFFGFLGGSSTNATLVIENIRFFSLAEPRLEIAESGHGTLLSWPLTAGGYVVETTPTLITQTWETVTNAPVISTDRYVLTNFWSDQARFFRLRAQ
jgi:pimeloyl-ACP methyl ester carboxylesterase